MFKSYFFIPANKKRFLEKAETIGNIDYRVFDLEDSVLVSDIEDSIKSLRDIRIRSTDWLRIPLLEKRVKQIIEISQQIGLNNYVIPKFKGFSEIKSIANDILTTNPSAKLILLLENAKSYIDLENILNEFSPYIHGVSLGIHDFTYSTGMKNDYMLLRDIRNNIMLLARAYSVEPIDVVSMYLKNKEALQDEILDGFRSGYRSKFLIHPFQLDVLKSVAFYTKDEVTEYEKILMYYNENIKGKEALFQYNNLVYEKMHIEEIKSIVNWGSEFYGTNR